MFRELSEQLRSVFMGYLGNQSLADLLCYVILLNKLCFAVTITQQFAKVF